MARPDSIRSTLATAAMVAIAMTTCSSLRAADWQFSVAQAGGKTRAWLWIPPKCQHVRGLIVAQQVILEKTVLDDPIIRSAAGDMNLAEVIFCPGFDTTFNYDKTRGDKAADVTLQRMLNDLAAESGYPEISTAPLLPIGHSGAGIYCWNLAYWAPKRVIGIVTLHSAPILPPAWDPKASADGIPVLADTGQYESWTGPAVSLEQHWRWVRGELLYLRGYNPHNLMSMVVEPGATHFSWSPDLAEYVALFIRQVAQARLPEGDAPPATAPPAPSTQPAIALRELQPESGWLTDLTFLTPSRLPPAPYAHFTGDPSLAFWQVDGELARANDNFEANYKAKKDQRVSFVQDGKSIPASWLQSLRFEPVEDGMTVRVSADFLPETPSNTAGAGQPLGHSRNGPIQFRLIGGWRGGGEQLGPDTFRIHFSHFGIDSHTNDLMIMAFHPGDDTYAYAEQAASITFPWKNDKGEAQRINFDRIPDISTDVHTMALTARADSGLRVEYLVESGPAEVAADRRSLSINAIPPRAAFPVKVRVIAYQWGRSIAPLVQSAAPAEQTFLITHAMP
jgi:hypothetical protein